MPIRLEKMRDFMFIHFFKSKITKDEGCSHDIKRHLLFGRKAMTKLDSILKSRDRIYLPKETKDLYIENYKSLMN